MNKNDNSIRQPYEIIETLEETITRYFNPNFCTTERTHISQRDNRHECPERNNYEQDDSDAKIKMRSSHFQDLLERFNKLRSAMSEITQRFEEINLIKAKVNTKFAVFNSDSGYEFHSNNGHEMKIQEDIKDFENEASPVELVSDENAKDGLQNCNSDVSVESQPMQNESMSQTIKQVNEIENNSCGLYCGKEYPLPLIFYPKRTDAALLTKSKKLLINLINKELEKAQSGEKAIHTKKSNVSVNIPVSLSNSVQRKMGCIDKIKEELNILKDLEGIDG